MIQSKGIEIIKILSKDELALFSRFLDSPFFNTNKNLLNLYDHLKKFYPTFDNPRLSNENIYKKIYGNQNYNYEKLKKLFSNLNKEAEKFLVIINLEKNKTEYNKMLLDELDIRKLDNLFYSKYDEAFALLERSDVQAGLFLEKHILKWHNITFHLERGEQHKIAPDIFERSEHIIFYFLTDLFLTLSDIESNKSRFNFFHEPNLPQKFIDCLDINSLIKFIDKNEFKNKELVQLYFHAYFMNKHSGDVTYFFEFRKFADENLEKFEKVGQLTIISFLINYCFKKINESGKTEFEEIQHSIYELFLRYELYHVREVYFRSDVFLNILTSYLNLKKVEEADSFLKKYISMTNPGHRKNMLALSNAMISYEKNEFDKALSDIALIKTNTFLFKARFRKLLLKIKYELKDFDEAKDALNYYRNYIVNNKKLSAAYLKNEMNFIDNYNELLKITYGRERNFHFDNLSSRIESQTGFTERKWFLEKLKEL